MNSAALVQLVVALVGGGTIAAVINAVMARKKLGADATKVITEAAAGVATDLRKDNADLRTEVATLRRQVTECEAREDRWELERREWRDILQVHAAWDHMAVTALRRAGVSDIALPPALYPPYRVGGVDS